MQEQFLNASMAALRGSTRDGAIILNGKDPSERQYAVFTTLAGTKQHCGTWLAEPNGMSTSIAADVRMCCRDILLGTSIHSRLLVVCHCVRDGETIRIISARKADTLERKTYEGYRHA